MEPVELMTGRLVLACPTEADVSAVVRICNDPAVVEFTTVPCPYREEDARGFLGEVAPAGWDSGTSCVWGICARGGRELLGVISLTGIADGTADLGYWIDSAVRGQGFMTEAVRAVIAVAFGEAPDGLGLERISWEAVTPNTASARIAQKTGFTWEGERRSAVVRLGKRYDLTVAGLLRGDDGTEKPWPAPGAGLTVR